MDGTLVGNNGKISRKNADAIRYFQQNGGLFTAATGRRPEHLDGFTDIFVCNTYIVSLNGSVIFDPVKREYTEKYPLCDDAKKDIKKMLETFPDIGALQIHAETKLFTKQQNEDADSFLARIDERIFDVMFIQNREKTALLKEIVPKEFPGYKFCRGWSEGLEMFSLQAGKGNAVLRVKALTGSVLAVTAGNYDNDTEMLKAADIGICVSGGTQEAKDAADYVTVSCDEDAIAVIIEELKKKTPFC